MKHLLRLLPALLCAVACQSTPTTASPETPAPPRQPLPQQLAATPAVDPVPAEAEHIEDTMLTINGKRHRGLTTRQLVSELGRPDSIAKGAVECGSQLESLNKLDGATGDFWYYGKTAYEVSGSEAMLSSFDVTTGRFRGKLGPLLLNQHTTLEEVRRYFPRAAREADKPATGRPGEVMSLPFYYQGKLMDESLELLFKQGRLQEVSFFLPC